MNINSYRQMRIDLTISRQCPTNPEGLHKWLLRLLHPTKKGSRIELDYDLQQSKLGPIDTFVKDFTALESKLTELEHAGRAHREKRKEHRWENESDRGNSDGEEDDIRMCRELRKIVAALRSHAHPSIIRLRLVLRQ